MTDCKKCTHIIVCGRYAATGGHIRQCGNFVSGFMINKLAAYENTGLNPDEIKELQGDVLRRLKESNKILRQNNDEYYVECQKLLDENHKLKSLLKVYLDAEEC